jgi:hypothetical protein
MGRLRAAAAGSAGVGVVSRPLVAACVAVLAAIGCSRDAKQTARFSAKDFGNLRWLEGDWRGQTSAGGYFYERYHFTDDSTIAMRGFEDSTFTRANDSATIVFRGGAVIDRGPRTQWSATRLDARGIDFAPIQGAINHFTWTRGSANKWTAAIHPAQGKPTVYQMERPPVSVVIKAPPTRR